MCTHSTQIRPNVAESSSNGSVLTEVTEVTKFVAIISTLQLMAIGLGMVMSLWAAMMLPKNDLGLITLVLLSEGIHILCHSSKLVLYRMHHMRHLPNPICFMSRLFYWVNLISVITSGVLSVTGLAYLLYTHNMPQNFGKREAALVFYVFYVLGISEVLVFLSVKTIWKLSYYTLLKKVEDKYRLEKSDMELIKRFFYDMHSKIMEDGKIVEGFKMDLVTYVKEIHDSSSGEEHSRAANLLNALGEIDTCQA